MRACSLLLPLATLAAALSPPLITASSSSSSSSLSPLSRSSIATRDVGVAASLAPLEQPSQVLFGSWVDMIGGTDSPSLTNDRFAFQKLGLFQTNMNIPEDLPQVPQLIAKIADTGTDAIAYLTVYPMQGFDKVTDAHIQELAGYLTKTARRFIIRYAPEMNGNWFAYGQDPAAFIENWRRFVTIMRQVVGDPSKVAFLWSPNSSNGYPFVGGAHHPSTHNDTSILKLLDTNKDNKFDMWDDPYSPFYPGDDYVSWVGLSMYHYGKAYPWVDNVLPAPGVFEAMLTGQVNYANGNYGVYNFYSMFSGDGRGQNVTTPVSAGGKPFMISETAAVFHQGYLKSGQSFDQATYLFPGPGMVAIKQAWWRQIFNQTIFTNYPKLKGICFFEFRKQEEDTLREFRVLGAHNATTKDGQEEETVRQAFVADVKGYEKKIRWGVPAKLGVAGADGGSSDAVAVTAAQRGVVLLTAGIVVLVGALLA
ncbi:hypothetical protein HDU86_006790 [Geranomyces michiganensis]|nr:hypothetical protein HDU86_006790 [Geranomyces michiganensis]